MKKKIAILLVSVLTVLETVNAGPVKNMTVYFEKGQWVLTAAEKTKLAALKQADMVMLQGHTDEDGSNDFNVALSKKRVEEVKSAIRNLDSDIKIEAGFYGENKPLNQNKNEAEKTQNRRVEISYISDPLLRIKTPVQFYEIDATRANTISCREGTQIEIPANAFASKKVLLKVSEYYNAASIFSANLSTSCNGAPIESAGMVYVTAEYKGENTEPTKALKFKFPHASNNKDFKVFTGERTSNFDMNWKLGNADAVKPAATAPVTASVTDSSILSIDNFTTNLYSATVNGYVYKQLDSFWTRLSDMDLQNEYLTGGCMTNATVDITVNQDGRITSVLTSYTDKKAECDRSLQKFIRACLPLRFKPQESQESTIHILFNAFQPDLSRSRFTASTLSAAYSDEFNADYETDKIVLSTMNLGWVNCDRFLKNQLSQYSIQADTNANVRLIMKKYKSFFNNVYDDNVTATLKAKGQGMFVFRKIPVGEEVLIVSTKKVNGKILLAMENAKTSQNGVYQNLKYKEVTAKELEAALKDLKI